MHERRREPRFALKPRRNIRVGEQVVANRLDRDPTIEGRVKRFVHRPEPAGTKSPIQTVARREHARQLPRNQCPSIVLFRLQDDVARITGLEWHWILTSRFYVLVLLGPRSAAGKAGPARGGSSASASYTTGNPPAWFSTLLIGTDASFGTVTYNAH
jgi:hypothetical protein